VKYAGALCCCCCYLSAGQVVHQVCYFSFWFIIQLAGHRHKGWCRRHRHSDIWHISPLPEQPGTGVVRYRSCPVPEQSVTEAFRYWISPVPNWFEHLHSLTFRYRTDRMPYSPAFTNWILINILTQKPRTHGRKGGWIFNLNLVHQFHFIGGKGSFFMCAVPTGVIKAKTILAKPRKRRFIEDSLSKMISLLF
jgi:hypothetical protein